LVYYLSLSGPFLFDDFPNLRPLISFNDGSLTWLEWVLGGTSGPTGRPVSLASFIFHASSYPENPLPFKITNLVIHIINGLVLFFLVKSLLKIMTLTEKESVCGALIASIFWLIHPFNMSSVTLVIQRMTLLMTFFSLLALCLYVHARSILLKAPVKAYLLIFSAFCLLGGLSVLSKENGALLPFYFLVLELTILQCLPIVNAQAWRWTKGLVIYLPCVLIIIGMFYIVWPTGGIYSNRDFNAVERVLTESQILLEYIRNILIPQLSGGGIFHDDRPFSTGLFSPITTIFSIIGVVSLLFVGFKVRHKYPVYAFAILFFFAGHVMESTFLNLELYFEHRNYLPMIGVALALGFTYARLKNNFIKLSVICYLALFVGISVSNAKVWGDEASIAQVWAKEHPGSLRAQRMLVNSYRSQSRIDLAQLQLINTMKQFPDNADLWLQYVIFECALKGELKDGLVKAVDRQLSSGVVAPGVDTILLNLIKIEKMDLCRGLDKPVITRFIDAMLSNPQITGRVTKQFLYYFSGNLFIALNNIPEAMTAYDSAFSQSPNIDLLFNQIEWMLAAGIYDVAEEYLQKAYELNEERSLYKKSRSQDIIVYRDKLNLAIEKK
jgi:tetratricopeptide (TPR) repeat protein